jgi:hypothetical protein
VVVDAQDERQADEVSSSYASDEAHLQVLGSRPALMSAIVSKIRARCW